MDPLTQQTSIEMQKILQLIQQDISTVRAGRATAGLVDSIEVVVYSGATKMKIMELATIGVSDSQTIVITPFDKSILDEVAKGIAEQNLGFNPANDGHVIRINIPPLSQERRQELIHLMRQKLENGKVLIRQKRHDAMDNIKKNEELSEDGKKGLEKEVQKITDEYIEKIDTMGKQKEEELMQI